MAAKARVDKAGSRSKTRTAQPSSRTPAKCAVLENRHIRIRFGAQGGIAGMETPDGRLSVAPRKKNGPLWKLAFRTASGKVSLVDSTQAEYHGAQPLDSAADGVALTWTVERFRATVTAMVRLMDDPEGGETIPEWRIKVEHDSDRALWEVRYPMLSGLGAFAGKGADDHAIFPWQLGVDLPDPMAALKAGGGNLADWMSEFAQCDTDHSEKKIAFCYPGMWAVQFMALYHEAGPGLYMGAHDGAARFKRFGLYLDGRDVYSLVMCNFPDERVEPNLDYETPYPLRLGLYEGGRKWYAPARFYRRWAVRQKWCAKGPTKNRKDIPRWLKNTDFWYWNWSNQMWDGMPELMTPVVTELKKRLDANVALHWYASHCEPFNQRIPEVFPIPPTFEKKFAEALAAMHKAGIRAIPYMNPRLCDPHTVTWDEHNVEALTCRTETGAIHFEEYLPALPWATVCPSQKKWHAVIARILEECVEHGYDGAYVDQVSSAYAVPCFAEHHDHPKGGGTTWTDGNRRMTAFSRKRVKKLNPDAVLTSESTVECYNDLFDANLARMVDNGIRQFFGSPRSFPIPLANAVYHEYIMTYGSLIDLNTTAPDLIYLGGALTLAGGNQLMFQGLKVAHLRQGTHDAVLGYFRTLVQYRKKYRKYFNLGAWEEPARLTTRTVKCYLHATRPDFPMPAILTCTFRYGRKRLFTFVNHTMKKETATATIDGKARRVTVSARNVTGLEV